VPADAWCSLDQMYRGSPAGQVKASLDACHAGAEDENLVRHRELAHGNRALLCHAEHGGSKQPFRFRCGARRIIRVHPGAVFANVCVGYLAPGESGRRDGLLNAGTQELGATPGHDDAVDFLGLDCLHQRGGAVRLTPGRSRFDYAYIRELLGKGR
jgi:hypothetical protein